MSLEAVCVGGPMHGRWIAVRHAPFEVPVLSPAKYWELDPDETVEHRSVLCRRERFRFGPTKPVTLFVADDLRDPEAMAEQVRDLFLRGTAALSEKLNREDPR